MSEAGCTDEEMTAVPGHKSATSPRIYTKGAKQTRLVESAITKGVVIVAAAGNDADGGETGTPHTVLDYPAAYDGVISVGMLVPPIVEMVRIGTGAAPPYDGPT